MSTGGAGSPGSAPKKGRCPVGGRGLQPSSHRITRIPVTEEKLSADPQGQRGATVSRGGGSGGVRAQLRGGLGTAGHSPEHRRGGGWDAVSHAVPARERPREGWVRPLGSFHDRSRMPQPPPCVRAVTAVVISSLAVNFDKIIINEHREVAWLLMRSPGRPPPSCSPPLGWEPLGAPHPIHRSLRPCCSPLRMETMCQMRANPDLKEERRDVKVCYPGGESPPSQAP